MSQTRAQFLRLLVMGSGSALAALSGSSTLFAAEAPQSVAGFRQQIGKDFVVLGSGRRLVLDEVIEGRKTRETVEFSLVFRSESPIDAGTYTVRNAAFGVFDLYLGAAGGRGQDFLSRADYNLLVKSVPIR